MRLALLTVTRGGADLAHQLASRLANCQHLPLTGKIGDLFSRAWASYDALICIMASGIVVRAIAPLLTDKFSDPAVIVTDESGKHFVSLLSGHLGGANELARKLAEITGGQPVITTASDVLGLPAIDLWAAELGLQADRRTLTEAAAHLVNHGSLSVFSESPLPSLPTGLVLAASANEAKLLISDGSNQADEQWLLRNRRLVVGIGCNRGTPVTEFSEALQEFFIDLGLNQNCIRNLASIDAKCDEAGLLAFARSRQLPIDFYPRQVINQTHGTTISPAALKAVGAIGVAEPTALLSSGGTLIARKRKWKNVTMAVARAPFSS